MKMTTIAWALLLSAAVHAQDKPELIATKDLPPSAVCAYCVALGTMMTPAKPTHGVRFRGKRYFFHDKSMFDAFMKDPDAYADPVLPRPIPKFELKTSAAENFANDYFKGKTILVDFWATWCEPCKKMFPSLDAIYDAHKGEGLALLSVNEDLKRKDFEKYVKDQPFGHPVLFDDRKAFSSWHVITIPALFLVKDGQIVAQWVGYTERKLIEDEVIKVLGGR
jgi:thiol-disulfide isomerase/thioredoxin